MIEFLFLLVEILAIVYLIHNIVGVSVKVDVYLIMLLAIGLGITIAIINDLIWDKGVCIVYGLLGLYVVEEWWMQYVFVVWHCVWLQFCRQFCSCQWGCFTIWCLMKICWF